MQKAGGKIALVTGASSGIGRATAEALARAGFTVFGTSRRPVEGGPKGVTMLTCDVTDDRSVQACVGEILSRTGRIDLLVNNAGRGLFGAAEESTVAQAQSLFDVNFFGLVRVINAVLPSMRRNRRGHIVNISSILGLVPAPFSAHYSATKHAVEGYSESLDHEVRDYGIRVSLIEPAFTKSAFDQGALAPDATLSDYEAVRTRMDALIKQAVAVGDSPDVVAATVVAAATAARPKRRYTAGKAARQISVARRFAPADMFDKSLRKQFGLAN